jgi:TPP-dependent pyruvate/acetoin dehydrogenase alpha subunit
VYDATHEACERARRGEGATLIEAKMMRMKGHAIHDAAAYVPQEMFEFYKLRDPITRFKTFLLDKKWLNAQENARLIAEVEHLVEDDREIAVGSPMPQPEEAATGVYCDMECHPITLKYGGVKLQNATKPGATPKQTEAAVHLT